MMSSPTVPREHEVLIRICLRHLVHFFWQGPGLLLVSRDGVGTILAHLARTGIAVLGLEGFELDGAEVHPRLDLIYDADWSTGRPTPEELVEAWPADIWIDITISVPGTAEQLG